MYGSSLGFSELPNTELKGESSRTEGRKPVKWHSEVSFCQSCNLPLSKMEMCLVRNSAHVSQFWVALTRYFPENPLLRSPLARWVICLSPTSLAHCLFGMAVDQLLIVSYKPRNPWKREAMFNHNRVQRTTMHICSNSRPSKLKGVNTELSLQSRKAQIAPPFFPGGGLRYREIAKIVGISVKLPLKMVLTMPSILWIRWVPCCDRHSSISENLNSNCRTVMTEKTL